MEVPRLWDARTGLLLANLSGHNGRVYRMAFSRDGKLFYTSSVDGISILRNGSNGAPLFTFRTPGSFFYAAAFDPTGNYLAAASDTSIWIWDTRTGKLAKHFGNTGRENEVSRISYNDRDDCILTEGATIDHYWDVATGKLLLQRKFDEKSKIMIPKSFTTDTSFTSSTQWTYGKEQPHKYKLVYADDEIDNKIEVIDSSGKLVSTIKGYTNVIGLLNYSPKGDTLYAEPDDRMFNTAWDPKLAQMVRTIAYTGIPRPILYRGDNEPNKNVMFNRDRSLAAVKSDNYFSIFDAHTGQPLSQFSRKRVEEKVRYGFFSDDNKMFVSVTYSEKDPAIVWDLKTDEMITALQFDKDLTISYASFSSDYQWLALYGFSYIKKGAIYIYDLKENTLITTIPLNNEQDIMSGDISPDKSMVCYSDANANFNVYDIRSKKTIYTIKEAGNYVRAAIFTPDSKAVVLSTNDNLVKVVDLGSKKIRYSFFPVDSTGYISLIPTGYYQGTPDAIKLLHYVTPDLKVISFEQLDVKYNRPDKVLMAAGNKDSMLIKSYRRAWEKRIKKLNIDTTTFRDNYSVPYCDILNRDEIEVAQRRSDISIHIVAHDSLYKLDRFNIWVNESPVFGQRGISIRKMGRNHLDTVIVIRLSQGENRIEASVINVNGTESYRMPVLTRYDPAVKQAVRTHFIGIGIDRFQNSNYNLQYSTKDIRDLAAAFRRSYGSDLVIDTLFNSSVTVENVQKLKRSLLSTTVNDRVIIAYSGHGLLSKNFDYFLSTYAIDFEKPEQKGLPYDDLEDLLDSIPARQKLMLIDACHSGEVDKEELKRIDNANSVNTNAKGAKPVAYETEGRLGMENSFELMQHIFVNVGKSTGATVISAAGGTQFALERGDLENGVFTYSILEAMEKNKTIKISELKKIVGARVLELTNGMQKPTSRNETIAVDWSLW